jgi:surfactin family lipopeptide synthetase A
VFPMSSQQERLWVVEQLSPDNAPYNLAYAFNWTGSLDRVVLERCLEEIVRRHESLRTVFRIFEGVPSQLVQPPRSVSIPYLDLSDRSASVRESDYQAYALKAAKQPFDLTSGPLFRFRLVRLREEQHVLLFLVHHIIFDSVSAGVFFRELSNLYEAYTSGMGSPLAELTVQYADYAVGQRRWLAGSLLREQVEYWRHQLLDASAPTEILPDCPRGSEKSFTGALILERFPFGLLESLGSLAESEGITLFSVLLAAFFVLLCRYTNQEDVRVGTTVTGRPQKSIENLIGLFSNTLVLRTDLSGNPSCRELLHRVRKTVAEAHGHADLPFGELLKELDRKPGRSRSPLFQIMFTEAEPMPADSEVAGSKLRWEQVPTQAALFDLSVSLKRSVEGLEVGFEYNPDLFEEATVRQLLGHYRNLLESMSQDPDQPIARLTVLAASERQELLVDWNATTVVYPERELCLDEIIERQARRVPDNIAVVFNREQLTYREMNGRANQLAHYLRKRGVGPDVLVGIWMERTPEMIAALLGVLKAGGAYVLLDQGPSSETHRLFQGNRELGVLVSQQSLLKAWSSATVRAVCVDRDRQALERESTDDLPRYTEPDHLACILSKSSSMGDPVGVEISHRNILNAVSSLKSTIGISERDTMLSLGRNSAHTGFLDVYGPLSVGARIALTPLWSTHEEEFERVLSSNNVTLADATPSVWRLLVDSGWKGKSDLKILCSGEPLSRILADQLIHRGASVWNLYGAAETALWSTLERIESGFRQVSIGRPIPNTAAYILDRNRQPVPAGALGELYLAGAGLARGYLDQPELTAERFLRLPSRPGERVFRTGDLARFLPDGRIQYLGRIDQQVKVQGKPVDLGEIESSLLAQEGIREAAVIARDDVARNRGLVAYLVRETGSSRGLRETLQSLKSQLAEYRVPIGCVVLPELPLTRSGKIDRKALGDLPFETSEELLGEIQTPPTRTEQTIAAIWREVLGVDRVDARDNFFDLGGHSLVAVKMFAKITSTLGIELPLNALFECPTVEQLARRIDTSAEEHPAHNLVPIQTSGTKPPLYWIPGGRAISVLALREVSLLLGNDQPVYGLESRLPAKGEEFRTVPERAAEYVERMRTVQPAGPYYLAGFCTGGMVAYEMAQQLRAQGEEVAFLGLVQAMVPGYPKSRAAVWRLHFQQRSYIFKTFAKFLLVRFTPEILGVRREYRQEIQTRVAKLLTGWVETSAQLPDDTQRANERVMGSYRPTPFPGTADLFLAEDCYETAGVSRTLDPRRAWRELVTGGSTIHMVPGNHYTMLRSPQAGKLADAIELCIQVASEKQARRVFSNDRDHPRPVATKKAGSLSATREKLKSIAIDLFPASLVRRWSRPDHSPIFLFHRILPEGTPCYDPEMVTSTEMFDRFLMWAKSRFEILSVEELLKKRRQTRRSKTPACAITFDDGWRDNFIHALPLLQRHGAAATVFLPVGFIGTNRKFWQERLWHSLDRSAKQGIRPHEVESICRSFSWGHQLSSRSMHVGKLGALLMSRPSGEAEEFVDRLERLCGNEQGTADRAFLNWEEVRVMQESQMEFGSHTVNHVLLPHASSRESLKEITQSRTELEKRLSRRIVGFSYPWGKTADRVIRQVEEAGYSYAITTRTRCVRPEDNRFLLPRVAISENVLRPRHRESCSQRADFYLAIAPLRSGNAANAR